MPCLILPDNQDLNHRLLPSVGERLEEHRTLLAIAHRGWVCMTFRPKFAPWFTFGVPLSIAISRGVGRVAVFTVRWVCCGGVGLGCLYSNVLKLIVVQVETPCIKNAGRPLSVRCDDGGS
jgi:hypothetical protein